MMTPSDLPRETPPESSADARRAEERFTDYLHRLSEATLRGDGLSRARLARLRSALGRRGVDHVAFREVGVALPSGISEQDAETYLLVAALFALHAAKSDKPWYGGYVRKDDSLGASCRRLGRGAGSMDARFAALLDARREDLAYRLRQVIALLAAHDIGVRYDVLLRDLLAWDDPRREVQRGWAADYWAPAGRSVAS